MFEKMDSIKDIIGESEYIVLKNGEVVESSNNTNKTTKIDTSISLKVIHFIDKDCDINLVIKENCQVHLEEIFYEIKNDCKININIVCKKNASLEHLSFKRSECSSLEINVKTTLYSGAYIENKNITILSSSCKYNQEFDLVEENSKIDSLDIVINSCNKIQEFNFDTIHLVPNTISEMHNYCISKNDSIIHMNTNGKIVKSATSSNLNQKTKGILLDSKAQISANPWLVIDEYDCMASHGASIGAIDEEELYYLMSRGLTKENSERLIVEGFIHPFINGLKDDGVKSFCLDFIKKVL